MEVTIIKRFVSKDVFSGADEVLLEKFILLLDAMNQAIGGLKVRWDVAVTAEP